VRIYRRLVEHQIAQIPQAWRLHIHFTPEDGRAEMRSWLGPNRDYSVQAAGDLGQRLCGAMQTHFAGGGEPLIFLGGDCPYLNLERLKEVAGLLDATDAVMIPAIDGGYCLLALRRPQEHLFEAISWSSERVAEQTRQRMQERS